MSIRVRPAARLVQLITGQALFGASMALMVRGQLGLNPWDVLHQGLAGHLGWTFGNITALTGVVVLMLWLPLRQRPGLGTLTNVIVIALTVDAVLATVPPMTTLPSQIVLLASGVVLNGFATAVYVGARLGPGPRDGLFTGLHARTGWPVRIVRTGIEIVVLAAGWLLGGTIGVGTVLFALAIGPLTQLFLPFTTVRGPAPTSVDA
ncbi:hypothetical protein GIY23_21195 [Allosaccharopolyspora coralli]|uniref:YitT family protein n=1 Tax=Allosaccharopolyspora coralli TaxID=2665642 RepID=A0A5Q3QCT0_9PSEU|nr:hypothetical protein [Allosaccharopolyspora coralli]QGK71700.1 hypothetical protein GIY23_21195 [Allosaccharopolyspora coralli]